MANESEAAAHNITELSVVDLKRDPKKGNTEGNNSNLIVQLHQQSKEEARGNPDEISSAPEIPGNKIPEKMGKGNTLKDDQTQDCGDGDFSEQQEINAISGEADVVEEKETIAEDPGEVHSSVPTETPSEDLQLLAQYMIVTDTYQDEDHSLVELQVEEMLTLDVDNDMQLDAPKADSTQVTTEKMVVTGNSSEMKNCQQECEMRGASIESTKNEQYPGIEQNNGKTMKDGGVGKADENDPLIVVGHEPDKSSNEDGKNIIDEANPVKGLSSNHSTLDAMGKNLLVGGLCSTKEGTCVKNLSSKNDKAKSEPDHKSSTSEEGRNVTGSKSSCNPKAENDQGQSGDKSSIHGKSNNQSNSQEDSRKRENDDRKDKRREKDEHKYRSSHSRTQSSERKRTGRERSRSPERRRRSRSSERRRRSRSSERRRRSRSSERRRRSRSSERRRRSRSSERRRRSRSSERRRRSRSSERRRRSRSSEWRRRSRSSERRRRRSRERSLSSERWKSKERRRTSRSRSQHRRPPSKNRSRDVSTEKTHESKEQPWQLDPKEALWAVERRREREIWEEEARELLERDLERLQLERMCLERGRLDESVLKRQRLLLEEETVQAQERTYREREELLGKMCFEEAVKQPFADIGACGAWERETRQNWEGREILRRELDQVKYERLRLDRKILEPETEDRLRLFLDGQTGKEQEKNYYEREGLLPEMYYEETLKRPDIGYSRGSSSNPSWKMEGFPDHSSQGILGMDLTLGSAVKRSLKSLHRIELAEGQRTDPSLEAVRYQAMHPNSKTDNDMGGTFLYKEGILIRRWSPKEGFFKGSEVFEEVVVPELYRDEILKVSHNIPSAEHQGIKRTGRRVLQYFYWPSVFMDVAHYCKACEKCRYSHKLGDAANLGLRPLPTINVPFKRVSIDVVGPLPFTTNSGKRYILMMVDCASRYPDATALVSVEADIVAMALLVMFTRVGFPEEILSNQGENFMSQLVMQLKRQCQDKQLRSNSYCPQVNELVEKFNGTLKQMLRTYAEQNPCDWDEKLPYLLFACREVPQQLTGFSPFELLYGRRVYGTLLLIKEAWLGKCFGADKNIVEHVLNARDALNSLIESIPEDQDHSLNSRNLWYCHNAGTRAYDIGQRVLVLQPVKRQKVQLHWEGPYTVVEPGKYVYYTVEIPFNKFRIYHVNMMKPYLDS
ncbi:SAFB-like transcription modulator [Carcharodon carcharias]|uniref:SAFB-like transcription modulator n=1 Tax=Carcharodon carcharias TaxID=13397 RepID=UPI001B7EE79C|nr:SAFB-like transcription modulator [Carcharodon carcharias]